MAKMNQTFKEVLQIVIFLLAVGIILMVAVIYPLNRTKALMARPNADDFDPDSLVLNDPALFVEAGLAADTFQIDADGLTLLSGAILTPAPDSAAQTEAASIVGTAILLHDERLDRASMIPLAQVLAASGFTTVVYDQRASGFSTGLYHGEGQYEASDLGEIVSYLDIRGRLVHPVTVIGRSLGAEAGLLAPIEETRIDAVVAISPYLSTTRMIDVLGSEHDAYWIPFFRTLFWWWYEMRSSYAAPYRTIEDIQPIACRTLILDAAESFEAEEYVRLKEMSDPNLLETAVLIDEEATLHETLLHFMMLPIDTAATP
ncbi:MAG: alpha/beta hydrolase [bacterium]|nr:alpha/beta hydrolase [bacterium]